MEEIEYCHCRVIHHERVARAKQTALSDTEIRDLSQIFKTMADPTRLKIILALQQEEMCVCDLAAFLDISESAVSHQLRTLKQMQFVCNRREGAVLYYRFANKNLSPLIQTGLTTLGQTND